MRILLAVPVLIVLIVFALSNQQVVRLGLWPTDILIDVPLSVAVLVASGLFFIAGAFMTWGASIAMQGRARRAERTVQQLEAQVQALKSRPSAGTRMAGTGMATVGSGAGTGMATTGAGGSTMALPPPGT